MVTRRKTTKIEEKHAPHRSRDLRDYIKVGLFQFYPAHQSYSMAQYAASILYMHAAKDKQKVTYNRAHKESSS